MTPFFTAITKHRYFNLYVAFFILLLVDVLFLLFMVSELSIYYKEAIALRNNESFEAKVANFSIYLFGRNDFSLRAPFIFMHALNCILLFFISLKLQTRAFDSIICIIFYMLIPGVSLEALLVSKAVFITFFAFLIIFSQMYYKRLLYPLFFISIFIDASSAILLLALFFYALLKKKNKTLIFAVLAFGINMYIFEPIHGVPRGYFLDTIGLMAVLFSPIFFIYYCYALYNFVIKRKDRIDFLVLIPLVGLSFILIVSMRQEILAQVFMPSLVCATPILVMKLLSDVRARLPRFNGMYKARFVFILLFLMLENIILFGNKITYAFEKEPNFASSFYVAKELAQALKDRNLHEIFTNNKNLALRLKFYGISSSQTYMLDDLEENPTTSKDYEDVIDIFYLGVLVERYKILPFDFINLIRGGLPGLDSFK